MLHCYQLEGIGFRIRCQIRSASLSTFALARAQSCADLIAIKLFLTVHVSCLFSRLWCGCFAGYGVVCSLLLDYEVPLSASLAAVPAQYQTVGVFDLHMATKTEWRDRASGFFALSSMKLRNATQTAGIFVGDVAKDAGTGVAEVAEMAAEVAERAGIAMRSRWSVLQQARQQNAQKSFSSDDTVQERLKSAAASTSVILKRSLLDTKEKVAVGRTRVEQVARRAAQRSRIILERWQKGHSGTNVFGVPLEILVQRQRSSRAVPQLIINCADYLAASGLNMENIFKSNGDQRVVQNLRYCFEEDWNTVIPEGTSPLDVAALLKRYLQMLPEPLLTFSVYNEIKEARGNVLQLADLVRTIPYAHYSTLECVTSLLLHVSQKSALNKMDAHSLAFELAPYLLWKQNTGPHADYQLPVTHDGRSPNGARVQDSQIRDVDSVIPLDDEPMMADFAIIEAVQCLIEQQKVIFAEPMDAIWHESGE